MAIGNYGLIVDTSNFKPFAFDDLVKPFLLYKQDYEKMQDKIEKYDEEFGKLSLPEDSQYYDTLQNFKNQYADVSQRIAEGDWARGSAEMRNLFRVARKDIAPIREATIARNKAVDDINKMRIQHPIIYDANDLKIDNFMGGNVPNIRLYNSDAIEADAAATIQAYAKAHPENPSLTKIRDGYLMLKQDGTPDEEAFKTALSMVGSEDTEGTNEYLSLLNKVLNKYDTEGSDVLKQGVRNSVIRGALKGVPATTIGVQHDQYGMNEAQERHAELEQKKHEAEEEAREIEYNLRGLFKDPVTGQFKYDREKHIQLLKDRQSALQEAGGLENPEGGELNEGSSDSFEFKGITYYKKLVDYDKKTGKPKYSYWQQGGETDTPTPITESSYGSAERQAKGTKEETKAEKLEKLRKKSQNRSPVYYNKYGESVEPTDESKYYGNGIENATIARDEELGISNKNVTRITPLHIKEKALGFDFLKGDEKRALTSSEIRDALRTSGYSDDEIDTLFEQKAVIVEMGSKGYRIRVEPSAIK